MTVKELKELLKDVDENLTVTVDMDEDGFFTAEEAEVKAFPEVGNFFNINSTNDM